MDTGATGFWGLRARRITAPPVLGGQGHRHCQGGEVGGKMQAPGEVLTGLYGLTVRPTNQSAGQPTNRPTVQPTERLTDQPSN